jgi:hypothetical protein
MYRDVKDAGSRVREGRVLRRGNGGLGGIRSRFELTRVGFMDTRP